jgi:hypothetical protein
MAKTIQKEVSVAANATVDNLFSGSQFEFIRRDAIISLAAVGSATGLVGTFQVGSDLVLEESPLAIRTSMPIIPDDFYYQTGAVSGDRVGLRIRNTTGAALTIRAIMQVQER